MFAGVESGGQKLAWSKAIMGNIEQFKIDMWDRFQSLSASENLVCSNPSAVILSIPKIGKSLFWIFCAIFWNQPTSFVLLVVEGELTIQTHSCHRDRDWELFIELAIIWDSTFGRLHDQIC